LIERRSGGEDASAAFGKKPRKFFGEKKGKTNVVLYSARKLKGRLPGRGVKMRSFAEKRGVRTRRCRLEKGRTATLGIKAGVTD